MSTALAPSRDAALARSVPVSAYAHGVRLPPPRFRAFCGWCGRARRACLNRPCATRAERRQAVERYDRAAKIEQRRYRALALGMSNLGVHHGR